MYFYITNSLGTYGFNTISPSMFFDKKKPYLAKKKYQYWVKVYNLYQMLWVDVF